MLVTQLKSFFAVARLGSVTLAAQQLGLSQPTVSSQIRALEDHFGFELFRRQGGRLLLSDAGTRLMPKVEVLLQVESDVEFTLRQTGNGASGQLRFGATAPYYVMGMLARYRARYPQMNVSVSFGNSQQMIDALHAYEADLVTSSRLETDARLLRHTLGHDPLVLVLHSDHPLAKKTSASIRDLAGQVLVLREPGSTTRELTEQALAAHAVVSAQILEVGSREGIREALVLRMGLSVFARHEAPSHPELRTLPFSEDLPQVVEYLYCLRDRSRSRLISGLLEIAKSDLAV